jgi:hypothetical protein
MTFSSTIKGDADMPHWRLTASASSRMLRSQMTSPVACSSTSELSRRSERVDAVFVESGRRPRSIASQGFAKLRRPSVGPDLTPRLELVGNDDLLFAPLLDGERPAVRDHERPYPPPTGCFREEEAHPQATPVGTSAAS